MVKIDLDLTPIEIKDLRTILTLVFDDFDFHGDLIPMEKPLNKLAKAIGMEKDYW